MAGHSKWAQIKRQKSAMDAKRGQLFTKLIREISVAARQGGADPEGNPRLRLAIQRARDANMPMDTIERAVKRGTGTGEVVNLEEIVYEGYGPGGAAILVEAMTDNRNRTAAEVRSAFTRGGGSLGESGCVSWNFEARGIITVNANGHDLEEVALQAIDLGAQDFQIDGDTLEVYTDPADLERVRRAMEEAGIPIASAETSMVPRTSIRLDPKDALAVLKLMDRLEELDDVQRVYTNLEITEEVLVEYQR